LIDGVVGYSYAPIRAMSAIGVLAAITGFFYAAIIVGRWLIYGHPVEGWVPIMCMILVMGGLQMLTAGIGGEYLWRTLAQVRQREPYIIENIYENDDALAGEAREMAPSRDRSVSAVENDAPNL